MKKFYFVISLLVCTSLMFVSCDKNANGPDTPPKTVEGVYVVNNGSWNDNNADIATYNIKDKSLSADVFAAANGIQCGDLAQDMIHVDDRLYISVNGSQLVYITDEKLKIVKTVTARNNGDVLSPRYLCSDDSYVYVSYYEGFLGRIDKDGNVDVTPVGPNPEGVACIDGKIFVANSGGYLYPTYNNTVSVVDAASFKEAGTVTVNCNPAAVKACCGKVYVSSLGNYGDIAPALQCIDPASLSTSRLPYESVSAFACDNEKLYILCGGYDANYNPLPGKVLSYDCAAGKDLGEWVSDATSLPQAYSISFAAGMVWVGCSDYKNEGDVYAFDASGRLYDKFSSKGINPILVSE